MCTSQAVDFDQICQFLIVFHTLYLLYCFVLILLLGLLQLLLLIDHTLTHLQLCRVLWVYIFFGGALIVQFGTTL